MGIFGKIIVCVDCRMEQYSKQGIIRGFDGVRYYVAFEGKKLLMRREQFVVL